MKKKSIIIMLSCILVFLSCKTDSNKNIQIKKNEIVVTKDSISSHKSNVKKINVTQDVKSKEDENHLFENLFNTELIGLVIKNKNEKDIYKKYWIDFSSICMCDSSSIFINREEGKFYLYSYCSQFNGSMSNFEDPFYEYTISNIEKSEESIEIYGVNSKIRNLEMVNEFEKITLIFIKIKDTPLYQLEFGDKIPSGAGLGEFKAIYTNESKKFEIEDCGDFDG